MRSSFLAIALSTLAAAAPRSPRQLVPKYPLTGISRGFRLIVNVTEPSKDLSPSVNNWVVDAYHTGAALNVAVLEPFDGTSGRIFYENGTAEDVRYGKTTVLTDIGSPPAPYGIYVQGQNETDEGQHGVVIDVGKWSGAGIARFPQPYATIWNAQGSGTFLACNSYVPYYQQNFTTLDYAYATYTTPNGTYDYQANIPEGCAPITLVPQCAPLNKLPAGSYSSHEFAAIDRCYEDVASIDWTQYGP